MTFNIEKFNNSIYRDRTKDIPVPELSSFFEEDSEPVWTVRGLTGEELAVVNEAVAANKNMNQIIASMVSGNNNEKIEALKQVIGIASDTVPDDLVRRFAMLVAGSVNPKCEQHIAVKLGQNFPTTLFKLTNEIISLTGDGRLGE